MKIDIDIIIFNQVINTLNTSTNCLIESPTGTGKSLSLLCSALTWQKNQKKFKFDENGIRIKHPKIYYGVRTIKQSQQLISELQKTEFKDIK